MHRHERVDTLLVDDRPISVSSSGLPEVIAGALLDAHPHPLRLRRVPRPGAISNVEIQPHLTSREDRTVTCLDDGIFRVERAAGTTSGWSSTKSSTIVTSGKILRLASSAPASIRRA